MERVAVRWATTAVPPGAASLLGDEELARWRRFRDVEDRDRYLAAHALVRMAVAERLHVAPAAVSIEQRCERCGGHHGAPVAIVGDRPGPSISFTHAGGVVAAAVAEVPVGVDVEPGDQPASVLAAIEPMSIEQWVAEEAAAKANGTGFRVEPGAVSYDGLHVVAIDTVPGYVGAVAVRSRRLPAIEVASVDWSRFTAGPGGPPPTATGRTGR